MPSENEIEAAIKEMRSGYMQLECGVVNFETALPIMAKDVLEAAEKVRAEEKRALELEKIFIHDACEQLAKGDL